MASAVASRQGCIARAATAAQILSASTSSITAMNSICAARNSRNYHASAIRRNQMQKPSSSNAIRSFSSTAAPANIFQSFMAKVMPAVKEITVEELDAAMAKHTGEASAETFHLFDVRETWEWNKGHIPTAFYTGRGSLERDIETLVPDLHDEIVLYCAGGVRSAIAARALQQMGYKNVKSLKGGITEWVGAGKPINKTLQVYSELEKY